MELYIMLHACASIKFVTRFDKKKFCRDCRKNVIREFKEIKEPKKRVPRERRCNCWFCVENGFQCEVRLPPPYSYPLHPHKKLLL
jgi:hypothetical protein